MERERGVETTCPHGETVAIPDQKQVLLGKCFYVNNLLLLCLASGCIYLLTGDRSISVPVLSHMHYTR